MALVPITIAGIYEAADGSLLAGKKFEVTPEAVFGSSGVIVPSGTVKVTTDATTAAYSFTLLTTDAVDAYVRYRVRFANTDQKKRFDLTDDISPVSLDVLINAFDPSQTASSSVVWLDHEARIEALEAGGGGGSGDVATDAIFDAKGDIPAGTGANTAAKLTAGANNTFLTPDSAQTTGLKWITASVLKALLSLVKGDVGLGNVDNTADTAKPVSTAQQTALDLKANLASPTFTGTVTMPDVAVTGSGAGKVTLDEGTPSGAAAGKSVLAPDSTTHRLQVSNNNGAFSNILTAADLNNTALTGVPTVPTATGGTNTTQAASTAFVAAAVALAVTGLLEFQGNTDCSANPNYPAGSKGDVYYVSVAGKIGGASGKSVDIGDAYVCKADNAGGTEASVGTSWFVLEHNLAGALLSANNLSDLANAGTARTNLGLGTLATQSGTFSGTSSGTNTGDQTISDATITTTDITTNNVSTTKHGFAPKGDGSTTKFLNANGAYSTPAGSGDAVTSGTLAQFAATTSLQLKGVISDETGSGALVFATSPALVTPDIGTPSAGVATNLTGTASGLTAGNVTTNANLAGDVTSVGNATTIGAAKVTLAMQANMATASLVYRKTAGSGAPEVNTLATLKTDLGLTGTNSGDQTLPTAASTTEVLTGTDSAKFATPDAIAALWEQGANIASAGTLVVGEGGYFHVTGTTTITDIDPATDKAGREFDLVFDGILTLTHNASTLILPTGANITTAVGDTARFRSEGSDIVRCVNYTRASGAALAGSGGGSSYSGTSVGLMLPNNPDLSASISAVAVTANVVYVQKILIPADIIVAKVSFRATGVASSHGAVAIYSADGNTKLLDSGAKDTGTSGYQTTTLGSPVTLPQGPYWYAYTTDTASASLVGIAVASTAAGIMNAAQAQLGTAANASVAGAMPSTLGAISSNTNNMVYSYLQG